MAEQLDRFRSFIERYVIARAGTFEVGREQEQAWLAIQDAKAVYGMAAQAKNGTDPVQETAGPPGVAGAATQAPSNPPYPTARGPRNAAKVPGGHPRPWAVMKIDVEPPPRSWMERVASALKTN